MLGKGVAALLVLLLVGAGGLAYQSYRTAEQAREVARVEAEARARTAAEAERQRLELTERLPRALDQGFGEVSGEARDAAARERAERIRADGRAALARGDRAGAQQAIADLEVLRADLRREYVLRIVSRPNEPSVVWRNPPRNRNQRNYYAIVEAVTPDGRVLSLPILNEENSSTVTVSKFGVRIPEATVNDIRRDKEDDGIVQRNRLGAKRRGALDVEYQMPVLGGFITAW